MNTFTTPSTFISSLNPTNSPEFLSVLSEIQSKSVKDKLIFKSDLSKVLEVLFSDWKPKIYTPCVSGNFNYSADEIATILIFGSSFDLKTEFVVSFEDYIPQTSDYFQGIILQLIVALAFKHFDPILYSVDFLKRYNDKFSHLSIERLAEVYFLSNYFKAA